MEQHTYPALADFMASWFHQDFDIEGETVAEVVSAYRESTPKVGQVTLRRDISRFLEDHTADVETTFEAIFHPDVIPAAFSGTTRAFLEEIRDLLPAS